MITESPAISGSSLAPEVLSKTFGPQPGFPALVMLDSTDPTVGAYFDISNMIKYGVPPARYPED